MKRTLSQLSSTKNNIKSKIYVEASEPILDKSDENLDQAQIIDEKEKSRALLAQLRSDVQEEYAKTDIQNDDDYHRMEPEE